MLTFKLRETSRGIQLRQLIRQPKALRPIVRLCLAQAVSEYASGKLATASILDRFGQSGLARYGFRHRSSGYVRRQTKDMALHGPAAFISPRGLNSKRILKSLSAIASANSAPGKLMAISRALVSNPTRPHLRDLVTRPGIGHRLVVSGNAQAKVNLTFPAAKALNAHPQYAEEFRDLSKAGFRDWRAITARTRQIFDRAMADIASGRQSLADFRGRQLMAGAA